MYNMYKAQLGLGNSSDLVHEGPRRLPAAQGVDPGADYRYMPRSTRCWIDYQHWGWLYSVIE